MRLTKRDIDHLRDEFFTMLSDEERGEEGGYDDVMTSVGYVAVWVDGDVTGPAGLLGRFDDDGDWTGVDDEDDADDGEE